MTRQKILDEAKNQVSEIDNEECDVNKKQKVADWKQDEKTGKAKAEYWCERHNKLCNDIKECQFEDNGEK